MNTIPVDDSGRTHAQYWALIGWLRLVRHHGEEGARAIMANRGHLAWIHEMASFAAYLGWPRQL